MAGRTRAAFLAAACCLVRYVRKKRSGRIGHPDPWDRVRYVANPGKRERDEIRRTKSGQTSETTGEPLRHEDLYRTRRGGAMYRLASSVAGSAAIQSHGLGLPALLGVPPSFTFRCGDGEQSIPPEASMCSRIVRADDQPTGQSLADWPTPCGRSSRSVGIHAVGIRRARPPNPDVDISGRPRVKRRPISRRHVAGLSSPLSVSDAADASATARPTHRESIEARWLEITA